MKKIRLFYYYLTAAILLSIQTTHATSNEHFSPMSPRILGEVGVSRIEKVNIDAMAPIYGNEDRIWYINGIGGYGSNSSWLGSVGTGVRNIFQNNWLIGGYLFADRSKTQCNSDFWVLNPGFELMHHRWDIHVNGYFPIHEKELKSLHIASSVGNNNYLYFHQHAELDNILASYDVIGKGADTEIGYSIPIKKSQIRIFAGGYFYAPHSVNNITGIQGGVEFPISQHLNLRLQDSHDNVFHNTASISLQFIFGGVQQTEGESLQKRMLDPIPRHLGTLNTGSSVLNQEQQYNTKQSVVVDNNLWFFQPGTGNLGQTVTQNSCTFEHPCAGLAQTTIDGINNLSSNAKFYLAPGQYNNMVAGNGFSLHAGQSIFGRTQNYLQLAQGNDRALVNDTLFLNGNNSVSNLQVNGQTNAENFMEPNVSRVGIVINKSAMGTVQINNSTITAMTTDAKHDAIGILNASLNANVYLQNSTAMALVSSEDSNAIGLTNWGTMQVSSSNLSGTGTGSSSLGWGVINSGVLTITNSILFGNATANNAIGTGVFNEDFGSVKVLNSIIAANSSDLSRGIFNEDFGSVNIANSTISANSSTLSDGIFNEDFGSVNIANSTIAVNSSTFAVGIFNEDFGSVKVLNSTISANSSALSDGIFNEDFGSVNIANSIIAANSSTFADGIFNEDFGSVNIANSTISANSSTFTDGTFNEDFGSVKVLNSTISANSSALSQGIFNEDFGSVNIANSIITANSSIYSAGIFNEDFGSVNIANSIITANSSVYSAGIFNEDFGSVNIVNSIIAAHSSSVADGIFNGDFGSVNIANSIITANSSIYSAGIFNEDFGSVNIVNAIIP